MRKGLAFLFGTPGGAAIGLFGYVIAYLVVENTQSILPLVVGLFSASAAAVWIYADFSNK